MGELGGVGAWWALAIKFVQQQLKGVHPCASDPKAGSLHPSPPRLVKTPQKKNKVEARKWGDER